jgi:DNA repair protein RecN (Recombination protein N)
MLKKLCIQNLATIVSAQIDFDTGFTVVTGESGAGKSVFLSGLRLISGHKASISQIRSGTNKATIEATFDLATCSNPQICATLQSLQIEADDEFIIQRELLNNGKSRCRINGTIVNQSDLLKLGETLVQFHGQSEQILLKDPKSYLRILDEFCSHPQMLLQHKELWQKERQLHHKKQQIVQEMAALKQQKEFFEHQYLELNKANLKLGEEAELDAKLALLESQEDLVESQAALDAIFFENEFTLAQLSKQAVHHLSTLANIQNSYQDLASRMDTVQIEITEIMRDFNTLKSHADFDPAETDRINSRLATLQRLKRKYNTDEAGLIALRDKRQKELSGIQGEDGILQELDFEIQQVQKERKLIANKLTASRKAAAIALEKKLLEGLRQLDMNNAQCSIQIEPSAPSEDGEDLVQFLLSANKGEQVKPLQNAVSGGELSRVMLVLKTLLASKDGTPVLVFDEVDSGISGQTGHRIGESLAALGQYHQVISITHLHQVAALAHHHISVYKSTDQERTQTLLKVLNHNEKVDEISRMLGGKGQASVEQHARSLLAGEQ